MLWIVSHTNRFERIGSVSVPKCVQPRGIRYLMQLFVVEFVCKMAFILLIVYRNDKNVKQFTNDRNRCFAKCFSIFIKTEKLRVNAIVWNNCTNRHTQLFLPHFYCLELIMVKRANKRNPIRTQWIYEIRHTAVCTNIVKAIDWSLFSFEEGIEIASKYAEIFWMQKKGELNSN